MVLITTYKLYMHNVWAQIDILLYKLFGSEYKNAKSSDPY